MLLPTRKSLSLNETVEIIPGTSAGVDMVVHLGLVHPRMHRGEPAFHIHFPLHIQNSLHWGFAEGVSVNLMTTQVQIANSVRWSAADHMVQ